jgi:hypothetical protein
MATLLGSITSTTDMDTYIKQTDLTAVTSNTTVSIPAGYYIADIIVRNTTANAITGGLRVGTTDGGADVVVALTVSASGIVAIPDAAILKRVFSVSGATTLFVQAVVAWNSANINIHFVLKRFV